MNPLYGTLSFPSSVLVLGEYAILEEGNIGIAAALPPRARITVIPAASFVAYGMFSGKRYRNPPLFDLCRQRVQGYLGSLKDTGELRVDTGHFYRNKEKRGLGSSAAAVLGYVAGLFLLQGCDPLSHGNDIYELSVHIHREFQGGGSAYDVATSFFGGVGRLTAGRLPKWEPQTVPWVVELANERTAISTAHAIAHCAQWRKTQGKAWRYFSEQSNRLVHEFLMISHYAELHPVFQKAKDLYAHFGAAISVPVSQESAVLSKAVGAGSELTIVLKEKSASSEPFPGMQFQSLE